MNVPNLYSAREIKEWSISARGPLGIWHMHRPLGMQGLFVRRRLKLAWGVFTMACFEAWRVPVGTKVYVAIEQAAKGKT